MNLTRGALVTVNPTNDEPVATDGPAPGRWEIVRFDTPGDYAQLAPEGSDPRSTRGHIWRAVRCLVPVA